MNKLTIILGIVFLMGSLSCRRNKLEPKGFSVSTEVESSDAGDGIVDGIVNDSIKMLTRPSSVLLTGNPRYRLTTIYKVNFNKKTERTFIGSNRFHTTYIYDEYEAGNNWNYHIMPGLEAVTGYNMVNVSHFNTETQVRKNFFSSPVLIRTVYFPSFEKDTLNYKPVNRDYYMISVYDEDTNGDGFIDVKDLRRFYSFDMEAENKHLLIPKNYSVLRSQYDSDNDVMFVYAKLDSNNNGQQDENEEVHIFWVDLKKPQETGRQY